MVASTKATKPATKMVLCPGCGRQFAKRGLAAHMRQSAACKSAPVVRDYAGHTWTILSTVKATPAILAPAVLCLTGGVVKLLTGGGWVVPALFVILAVVLTAAAWAVLMQALLKPVLVLRSVKGISVWEWQFWEKAQVEVLSDEARWRKGGQEVFVLDRTTGDGLLGHDPFRPLSKRDIWATPQIVAAVTHDGDIMEVNQQHGRKWRRDVVKTGALLAMFGGLLVANYLVAIKLLES